MTGLQPKPLFGLLQAAGLDATRAGHRTVNQITSRACGVSPSAVYVACLHDFGDARGPDVAEALDRGAGCVIVRHPHAKTEWLNDRVLGVPSPRLARGVLASRFFNDAHRRLRLIGVTGTKGKTTVCHWVASVLTANSISAGILSSSARVSPGGRHPATSTTPEPFEIHYWLSVMVFEGASHAIIEASSIGIEEQRLHCLHFDCVAFTNLGADHLTYHGGIERYAQAKAQLFAPPMLRDGGRTATCVINADDPFGEALLRSCSAKPVAYGLHRGDLRPTSVQDATQELSLEIGGQHIRSSLFGEHNLYNLLCVAAISRALGVGNEGVASGIQAFRGVAGRLEFIEPLPPGLRTAVVVDYAHTPESVEASLVAIRRKVGPRRLVAVVGCGGGRDRSKRPVMARFARSHSDVCVLTSDNPRDEEPLAILRDMSGGFSAPGEAPEVVVIEDRREAISYALSAAQPDGVVAILGKGDERTQVVRGRALPFSDREVALELLWRDASAPRG